MKRRLQCRKGIIAFILISVIHQFAEAQQRPYYTQYILNNYIINPAVAGIENYWDVKMSNRLQWVGLQDAPVSTYLTIQGPLHRDAYDRENPTSFHAPGENPRGTAYWENYTTEPAHSGVGLTVLNDVTGPLNRFELAGTYAYHVGLAPHLNLSVGITAGFSQMSLDASKLSFATTIDPAVGTSSIINRLKPDISAGTWLYGKDFFAGISCQQIIPDNLTFSDNAVSVQTGKLIPHTFFELGYRTMLDEDISFIPSIQVRYINPLPLGFDLNFKFQYQDFLWAGASYRNNSGYAVMLGVNFSRFMNFSYSYDYSTSALNTVSKGTHEILIGFMLNNKYGDWCPRNLW